jgi:hypothetical protein
LRNSEKCKMAEIAEKRGRGRPRKSLALLRVLGAVNVTRHAERLADDAGEAPEQPLPKMPPEIKPWVMTFQYGRDYFQLLPEIGLKGNAVDDPKVRRAAREAWQRLGAKFLAAREPDPHGRTPWVLRKWGQPPPRCTHKPTAKC